MAKPYLELVGNRLVAFSDLHGTGANLREHLAYLHSEIGELRVLFLGDAIDRWFPATLAGQHDHNGERLLRHYQDDLSEFLRTCPSPAVPQFREAVEASIKGGAFYSLPIGALRRALIGAIESYKTLRALQNTTDLIFLLGNHEIDLLSGAWSYRSLQKSFFLNICGVSGLWCLEYRDSIKGFEPLRIGTEMSELRESLLHAGFSETMRSFEGYDGVLKWLGSRPFIAGFKQWVFMHGGPTPGFVKLLERLNSIEQLNDFILEELQENGFASPFFRETAGDGDTFLAPQYGPQHFIHDSSLIRKCTSFFGKENLAVGHSALLGSSDWKNPFTRQIVLLPSHQLLKLDAGKKRHFDNGSHYVVISQDSTRAYSFIDRSLAGVYVP